MSGTSSHEHLLLINDARPLPKYGASSALQDAALVDLLEQLHVLPVVHVDAHEHRAGRVEGSCARCALIWSGRSMRRPVAPKASAYLTVSTARPALQKHILCPAPRAFQPVHPHRSWFIPLVVLSSSFLLWLTIQLFREPRLCRWRGSPLKRFRIGGVGLHSRRAFECRRVRPRSAAEHVAAPGAVFGEEVKVIPRNAKGARVAWGPQAHQGALDVCEAEFRLRLRSSRETRTCPAGFTARVCMRAKKPSARRA